MSSFRIDLIGIGPQKTGSTWLHEVIFSHPQISLPIGTKETFFFDKYYDKGIEWYADYFPKSNNTRQKIGEIGPTYFDCPQAIERIHQLNPACKIIINIRNPISRAISLHHHHLNKGRVSPNFSEAINKMPEIITSGHYSQYIPRWLETFGQNQVHLIFLDDIQDNKEQVWQQLCKFLGIDLILLPDLANEKVNQKRISKYPWLARLGVEVAIKMREYKLHNLVEKMKELGLKKIYSGGENRIMPLTESEHQFLKEIYENDIVYLEKLTGRDLTSWRNSQW